MCGCVFANKSESASDTAKNLSSGRLSHHDGAGGRLMAESKDWMVHVLVSSMSSISESCGIRNTSGDMRGDCSSSIAALFHERGPVCTLRNVQISASPADT